MLSSHMEDMGITPEDFEKACKETEKNIHSQFRKVSNHAKYSAHPSNSPPEELIVEWWLKCFALYLYGKDLHYVIITYE